MAVMEGPDRRLMIAAMCLNSASFSSLFKVIDRAIFFVLQNNLTDFTANKIRCIKSSLHACNFHYIS